MISSYPPRPCGIATFTEEAVEFLKKHIKNREIHIISHTDGKGENVHPIMDLSKKEWYKPVAKKIKELNPYAVHIQHEYGLYMYYNKKGEHDNNQGFLELLDLISNYPIIIEPHTIHGRLRPQEEWFIKQLIEKSTILIFKCLFQRWRLSWNFKNQQIESPNNIIIIPHGARPDKLSFNKNAKQNLGIKELQNKKVLGILGWIQPNKRWDIIIDVWEEISKEIYKKTKEKWILFCAGTALLHENERILQKFIHKIRKLEKKGLAKFYRFSPRGDLYYKVMAACDVVTLPSLDETQSGTLARITSLAKPYITTAPMEGLTSQTIESEGGLLFTDLNTLKRSLLRLATDKTLRKKLSINQKKYLENSVSWNIVAKKYIHCYDLADKAKKIKGYKFKEEGFKELW